MAAFRTLLCLVFATTSALWSPVSAQVRTGPTISSTNNLPAPPRGTWLPGGRSYLGLHVGSSRYGASCAPTAFFCDDQDRSTQLFTGVMVGNFWGVELGYLNMGRIARTGGEATAQGLALSVVGKTKLGPRVGVFGKLGTTYGRTESSALVASAIANGSEQGFGLSFGAGVSFDFTPRLSATLEWESNDFRFAGGGRDPVRGASLGLKYRY